MTKSSVVKNCNTMSVKGSFYEEGGKEFRAYTHWVQMDAK